MPYIHLIADDSDHEAEMCDNSVVNKCKPQPNNSQQIKQKLARLKSQTGMFSQAPSNLYELLRFGTVPPNNVLLF